MSGIAVDIHTEWNDKMGLEDKVFVSTVSGLKVFYLWHRSFNEVSILYSFRNNVGRHSYPQHRIASKVPRKNSRFRLVSFELLLCLTRSAVRNCKDQAIDWLPYWMFHSFLSGVWFRVRLPLSETFYEIARVPTTAHALWKVAGT